jgi:hypothetical protein
MNQRNGEAGTFDAALEALKNQFWNWHAWALKQPGHVTGMEQMYESARR